MKIATDSDCPKCGYPETILEVLHNNLGDERRQRYCNNCGWCGPKRYRSASVMNKSKNKTAKIHDEERYVGKEEMERALKLAEKFIPEGKE